MQQKISRKKFITDSLLAGAGVFMLPRVIAKGKETVMTVNGSIDAEKMGFTLTHEHVMADFIGAEQFTKSRYNADEVFQTVMDFYKRKQEAVAQQAYPVIKDVYETRGQYVENIVVPFSDGIHGIQVAVPLKKAVENHGHEVFKSFEKNVTLYLIDDAWKEHLREMDELKQSVQNAVYEQKDPLLVYKFEAFELFRGMLANVNKEIVSFLFRGGIPVQQQAEEVREARPEPKLDLRKMKTTKAEVVSESNGVPMDDFPQEQQKITPVRVENKIGRNDPCPCGSGKKYKNCHGVGQN